MDKEQLAKLIELFREEADESIEELRHAIERFESEGASVDVGDCMRLAHNLKGASAGVGFEDFSSLAHLLEDGFSLLQEQSAPPSDSQVRACLDALDDLERLRDGEAPVLTAAEWQRRLTAEGQFASPEEAATAEGAATREERVERGAEAEPPVEGDSDSASPSSQVPASGEVRSLRVSASKLDDLLRLSADLLTLPARARSKATAMATLVETFADSLRARPREEQRRWASLLGELRDQVESERWEQGRLARLLSDFEGTVRTLRRTRLESAVAGWRRSVVDAALRMGKEVHFSADVGDIEIDKVVHDRLRVPILHLLRNAVAHGVETTAARFAAGKVRRGQIRLRAELRGRRVRLTIDDDGAGIDAEAIRTTAVARGLASEIEAQALDGRALGELLFHPGFSTAAQADSVRGRGMGLHEVRLALQELGGDVEVRSESSFGCGTRFELSFPVSTLTTRGLLVREGRQIYALPLDAVERTMPIGAAELSPLDGGFVLQLDGAAIRARFLSELLGQEAKAKSGALAMVIVKTPKGRMGLGVDAVLWDEELVVKPLPWNIAALPQFSGLVSFSEGSLGALLDARALFSAAARTVAAPQAERPVGNARVLVVEDSLTRRTLHLNLLSSAGYEVEGAVDGLDAWAKLHAGSFDLMVSDIEMPQLDGFELTRRVRQDPARSGLPIVLVTGMQGPEDEARGIEAGANAYVAKGNFDGERLLAEVARLLGTTR